MQQQKRTLSKSRLTIRGATSGLGWRVNRLPPVRRIGAVHLPEGGPSVPKSLTIEYSDRSNASKWYQLEVPFVDAMHLLALL
jgi:hypothetical protein